MPPEELINVAVNLAASGTREIIATPGALKQLWIYGYEYHVSAASTVKFQDSTPNVLTGIMPFAANGGVARDREHHPIWKCATNTALQAVLGAMDLDGSIQYSIVEVAG